MRKYPAENWKRLGEWVHDARLRTGWTDMKEWAVTVGRSTRQLQGLERGEPVGEKTLERVAAKLNVGLDALIDILAETAEDEPEFVSGSGQTESPTPPAWNTRKPEGMSDAEHRRILQEAEEYYQWLIEKASRER